MNSGSLLRNAALVSGDFVKTGGMDRANYALADYLIREHASVTLAAHRVAPELLAPNTRFRRVPKPFGSYRLGEPLLDAVGRFSVHEARRRGGVGIVNGGNCLSGRVNWMHYVHAVYPPPFGPAPRAALGFLTAAEYRRRERIALGRAELVFTNSAATRRAVIELGVPAERAVVVYYGIDSRAFAPVTEHEAAECRRELGFSDRPTVAFVGALGDRRKGFDTLFQAFERLCASSSWDADLVAVGAGAAVEGFRERARRARLSERIRLLGFRKDVPRVLAASDVLAAPTRYEAFGLGVAEALARGLPALVSASAGVAELYPPELDDLLLYDPESAVELERALLRWRERHGELKERLSPLSERVRARSWDDMAREIVSLVDERLG